MKKQIEQDKQKEDLVKEKETGDYYAEMEASRKNKLEKLEREMKVGCD